MPNYFYYFVRAIGKRNFLLRVEICDNARARAVEFAAEYVGSSNFNIKKATMEDIFGYTYNIVDLTPVIVNLN